MPLMKSKSSKAFSHNVSAEMHAGKPQNQALAIAYSVKRHGKKKAHGGIMNEKLHAAHESIHPSRAMHLADMVMQSKKLACGGMYAHGGEVDGMDEDAMDEMEMRDHSDEDQLSEDHFAEGGEAEPTLQEMYDHDDPSQKRKDRIKSIISGMNK